MFHSRRTDNRINRLHERALRIVYDDNVSTFDQLLAMDQSFCIHHQNIQRLLTEIYNVSGNSLKELLVKISITASKHLRKELKILNICGIFVLSIFIVYVHYLRKFTAS